MLAAALAQTPHVRRQGRARLRGLRPGNALGPRHDKPAVEPAQRRLWLRYLPPAARCAAPEFSAGHRELAGGSDFSIVPSWPQLSEFVARLEKSAPPWLFNASAAILQLLTAQTNCQFSNVVRRQRLKCHW